MSTPTLTQAQEAEMRRLKQYFPYRIVYGAVRGEKWECGAMKTNRRPNDLLRKGGTVFTL